MLCGDSLKVLLSHGVYIGEPINTSNQRYFYPLFQNETRTQIVCQTPWMRLCSPPRYIKRKANRVYFLDFHLYETHNREHQQWKHFLSKLHTLFQKWLAKFPKYKTYRWINCLESYNEYTFLNNTPPADVDARQTAHRPVVKWKLNTSFTSALKYFDINQNEKPIADFIESKQTNTVRLLVHLNQVWVNTHSETVGLNIQILQVQDQQIFNPPRYAFQSDTPQQIRVCDAGTQTDYVEIGHQCSSSVSHTPPDTRTQTDTKSDNCSHPIYGTYFRMLQKCVPKPAVQHKMRMNGLDPAVLELDSLDGLDTPAEVPQPDQLTLSLKDDHQLKKTEINKHEKNTNATGDGHGFSLHEIMSGLKSLRKTMVPEKKTVKPHISEKQRTQQLSLQSTLKSNSFIRLLGSTFS
jgi:hypothetical protein